MNPEEGGDDSQDSDSGQEEETLVPKIMDDEFFTQLIQNGNLVIKNLQSNKETVLATEFHKMLIVCQKLRSKVAGQKTMIEENKEEIASTKEKLLEAIKASQLDQDTIEGLKISIENSWKQTDAAQEREQAAFDQLNAVHEKMERLQDEVQKLTEKKELVEDLGSKHKEGILKERDRLAAEVEELNRRIAIQKLYAEEVERKRSEVEQKNKELYKILDETSSEAFKERRLLDQTKSQLIEITTERNSTIEQIKALKLQSEIHVKNTVQQNLQILAAKSSLERVNTQYNIVTNKLLRAMADLDQVSQAKDKVQNELNQKSNLLKLKEDENVKLKQDNNKLWKAKDAVVKKLQTVEQAKFAVDQEIVKIRNQETVHEKNLETGNRTIEKLTSQVESAIRERDMLRKELVRTTRQIADHNAAISVAHQEIKTLKNELKLHGQTEMKQKAIITKIEVERDRNAEESQLMGDRADALQDEIHLKDKYITELKGTVQDIQAKLSHTQNLYENARSERAVMKRNLESILDERTELKETSAEYQKEIEQMKHGLAARDLDISKAQKHAEKLEKDRQLLKIEIRNMEVLLQSTRSELKEKRMENDRLYKSLADEEKQFSKLKRTFDELIHEKDTTTAQLVKKNEEFATLTEKLQMTQQSLDKNEIQYEKRLDDIRLLKIEVNNLKSQRDVLSKGLANTADMRQEVLQLHRVLNQERVKAKALEEEMLTPMNVHRWRSLSGKDPERMELITKTQSLQKRLLNQTVTATEREQALQEAQKMYSSLKQFMLKLPSYKVKERLNETQYALSTQSKKMKALMAEINAKEVDEKAKDCMVEELRSNLTSAKKDLLREKKQKQKLLEEREIIYQMQSYSAPLVGTKTLGSGFKMPMTT